MGNPTYNILRTADLRAKQMKIWDSGLLQCIYVRYFWCPIPWVWFGVIWCTLQNLWFYDFWNVTPSTVNFHQNSTKLFSMALSNFNMEVNGKILKCAISRIQLIIERKGRKFGTWGTKVHKCRALFMPDCLSLVWGHSVHFAKFMILLFSKHYSLNSFHQNSTKLNIWSIIISG